MRFHPADGVDPDLRSRLAELFRAAADVIRSAEPGSVVLAVNSYLEVDRNADAHDHVREAAKPYLDEYRKRFGDLYYHRLIQLGVGDGSRGARRENLAAVVNESYYAHYRDMADYSAENPASGVRIEEAGPVIPISFVVVKDGDGPGGRIIWQIHRHPEGDPNGPMTMLGILIVNDPDGQLVPTFESWFNLINRGPRRELVPDDFRDEHS